MRPAQWNGVEIAIAAATLVPVAQTVSKKWAAIDTRLGIRHLTPRTLDFDFLGFLLIIALLIWLPPKRKVVRKATRASAAARFELAPIPEDEPKP